MFPLPDHSEAILSRTHPRLSHPTCVSISFGYTSRFSFRLLLCCATTSCFSTEMSVSVWSKPHWALDHKPTPLLSTCTLQSLQMRKWQLHLGPNCSGRPFRSLTVPSGVLVHFPFESEQTAHDLCLPTFNSVQDRMTPGKFFSSKEKCATDVLHHSSALHPPRHVFGKSSHLHTQPCLHVLSSKQSCVLFCMIESVSQKCETLLARYILCCLVRVPIIMPSIFYSAYVLVDHRLAGFGSMPLRLLDENLHHFLWVCFV